jgi:hypothetical protein
MEDNNKMLVPDADQLGVENAFLFVITNEIYGPIDGHFYGLCARTRL